MIITIIVALHVIPITIVVLFLTGVFQFRKTQAFEPASHPAAIVKHTTPPTPRKPPPAEHAPPPKRPAPATDPWELPIVLPPAGLASLIMSAPNPPLPSGGIPLPPRIAPIIRDFETRHTGPVHALAIVPGGKYLLSAGADRQIRIWDTATAKQVKTLASPGDVVRCLAVNGFGSAAASGGEDGAIRIWDLSLGREAFVLTGHVGSVRGVTFSPNGKYILSGGEDGTIRLWDTETREEVRNLKLGQPARCVAFCPDCRRALAGAADGSLTIFDLEAAKPLHAMTGHSSAVTGVAFSRDGREAISASEDKKILLWDVATGARLPIGAARQVSGILYEHALQGVAYAGDGSWVVSVVADSSAAVLQPHGTGRQRITIPPHGTPLCLAVAPDGSALYFGTEKGAVRRMDFQGGTDTIPTSP